MVNLLYLGVPLALLVLLALVFTLRGHRPRSMEGEVEEFSRGLRALAPPRPGGPVTLRGAGTNSTSRAPPRGGSRPG